MPTPIILIGIGTSGLYVLENVQRFYYESYRINKPKHVEYIYLETNKDNMVGITPEPNEISRVYISLNQIELMVDEIRRTSKDTEWLPPKAQIVDAGAGAGGVRPCGRLALWGNNDEGNNFQKVVDAIYHAHANISSYTQDANVDTHPVVYITGSLTGGTGSGICVDMAYLVKYVVRNVRFIYGLFLLPKTPSTMRGFEVMYANSYGAMKDIEAYNSIDNLYKEEWPNGYQAKYINPPYELVQYITQDYCDGSPALKSLDGLYKMAGLYLFLNVAGIYQKRKERLVDARGAMAIGKYGTFGLSGIQYPKDIIQEYIAAELSKELLEKWVDGKHYIQRDEPKAINPPLIKQEVVQEWTRIIEKSFETLNTVTGRDLVKEIESEAARINSNELTEPKDLHLLKLFSSNHDGGFYALVQNNVQAAVNEMIDQIHDLHVKKLDQTENLEYAKIVLEAIVQAIDSTLNYWKSLGLSSKTELWENQLRSQVNHMLTKQFKVVFEQNTILQERMLNTFKLMKVHLLIPKLIEIKKYIVGESISLRNSQTGKELPKQATINNLIDRIFEVSGKKESKYLSIRQRIEEIESDIRDETIPILRIYPTGSFETEKGNAKSQFKNWANKRNPSKQDFTDESLWTYLTKNLHQFHSALYRDLLTGYRRKISQSACIQDYDVGQYVITHPEEGVKMASRALSPFISVKDVAFSFNPAIPRFIAGATETMVENVIRSFENSGFHEFRNSNDGRCEIKGLNNIIVFYDEKGNYNPMKHLSYIKQMEDVYRTPPQYIVDNNMTTELWYNYRNAYISKKADSPKE